MEDKETINKQELSKALSMGFELIGYPSIAIASLAILVLIVADNVVYRTVGMLLISGFNYIVGIKLIKLSKRMKRGAEKWDF